MKITRNQLRKIIKEAIRDFASEGPGAEYEVDEGFPELSHPLLTPYFDKLGYRNSRGGKWFKSYQTYTYNAGGLSHQGIVVYFLPDGKYTARVNGSYNNTISAPINRLGKNFDTAEAAIEAALNSGPSGTGPTAAELLKKVGEKVDTSGYYGQD